MAARQDAKTRVPDFFIVGQPKAGTTALHQLLLQHPRIFMPDLKEPMYLASDMRDRFRTPRKGAIVNLDDYLALFEQRHPGQIAGEASTLYLFSKTAARSIAGLNPEARIIAIFREPVSFLHSLHLQHRQDHQEDQRDLRRAMALESERAYGRHIPRRSYRPQDLQYSEHIRYTDQLKRYHAAFPKEQVLPLLYDDFRADNIGTTRQILEFLGVDDEVPILPADANPTVWLRSQLLDDTVHRLSVGRGPFSKATKGVVKLVSGRSVRQRLLTTVQTRVLVAPPPRPEPEFSAELRMHFKPEVERFAEYIGRDLLTLWSYGDA